MSNRRQFDRVTMYQIRVKGILDATWSEWLDGCEIVPLSEGEETILMCRVVDQAALFGLLNKIRDMALPLLAVQLVDEDGEEVAQ